MTQYNSLNLKPSNSQYDKIKSAIKNESQVVLRLPSNMIGNDETNFPDKLLLTNRQVSNLRKAFSNYSSTDIKSSKTQISKMIQSGGFLGRLFGPLLKTGLTLIISNDEMEHVIKIVKSLQDSGLLLKGVSETVQNEAEEKREDFLLCCYVHCVHVYWEIF